MLLKKLEQLRLYNNWANEILFKTFEAYGDQMPASCLRLHSHIVNAQSTWLCRVNGEKQVVGLWDVHDLEGVENGMRKRRKGSKPPWNSMLTILIQRSNMLIRKGVFFRILYTTYYFRYLITLPITGDRSPWKCGRMSCSLSIQIILIS